MRRSPRRWVKNWWLDQSVRIKGVIAVTVPLFALILIVLASVVLQQNEQQERQVALVASALSTSVNQILTDTLDAETAVRGYVATDNPVFLRPYFTTVARLPHDIAAFQSAAAAEGDSGSESTIQTAAAQAMGQLAYMQAVTARGATASSLRPEMLLEKQAVDTLRSQVAALAAEPIAIVNARRADINRMESDIDTLTIIGLILGILAGILGNVLMTSGISHRVIAIGANADRLGQGEPLQPLPAARDELGRLAHALVQAEGLLHSRSAEIIAARDAAVSATESKNMFLSTTSHEIRTPLNAILGFTQLLQLSDLSAEDRDAVERILGAGRHLLALINELIDIARIESGELSLSVEPVLVRPLVEETCQLMAALAAARSITIMQPSPNSGLAVSADQQRLRQILMNLVSNAIKYNRPGGTVSITCQAETDDQVSLVVTDTGPGISAVDLDRIFVPFERLGAEQTGIEGTGIGLPLARALAQAMAGQLTASSVPGKGSAFAVTLPHAVMPWTHERADTIPSAPITPVDLDAAAIRILYVEDNPANTEVVSRYVKTRANVVLRTAATGEAGLEAALRHLPDLILLDMHLPDMNGEEVLRQLRAGPSTEDIPVAVLSAEATPAVIRRVQGKGVVAYLTKPLDLAELGRLIYSFRTKEHSDAIPGTTLR